MAAPGRGPPPGTRDALAALPGTDRQTLLLSLARARAGLVSLISCLSTERLAALAER